MLVLVSAIKYTGSMNFRSESTLREVVIIIHPPPLSGTGELAGSSGGDKVNNALHNGYVPRVQ